MLFISPPFGNYINLPNTMSIKGSFTLEPRKGLLGQIFRTLRYSWEKKGWINKIGLRNRGIDWAIAKYRDRKDCVISLAFVGKNRHEIDNEIAEFSKRVPEDMNIELNVSCPNVDKSKIDEGLGEFINDKREWCIIKLSPLETFNQIDRYYKQGFRQFHCCNTLPVPPRGGLSGVSLIPYNTILIKYLRENYDDVIIIAGGGIRNGETVDYYRGLGATHFAVSTLLFSPLKFATLYFERFM